MFKFSYVRGVHRELDWISHSEETSSRRCDTHNMHTIEKVEKLELVDFTTTRVISSIEKFEVCENFMGQYLNKIFDTLEYSVF